MSFCFVRKLSNRYKFECSSLKFGFVFCRTTKTAFSPLVSKFRKTEVISLSFFSCRTDENRFLPESEQTHFKPLSIRFYFVKPTYSKFRSLFVIVAKAKSLILSFKICEELSAVQKPEKEQIRDNKTRLFMS